MLVVTGATGQLGRLVIDTLLTEVPAGEIAAVVRDEHKAAPLAERGVRIHVADYDRPETLKSAFGPGDRVLLISGNAVGRRVPQHRAVIGAAEDAGVALLAYTGILGGPAADFRLADEHRATEEALAAASVPHTFLRNGWYHENYTASLAGVLERGVILGSAGADGRVASASRADYAAAAAAVLTGEGHAGAAYELSGDTAWSFGEYAAELSRQSGREIVYREVSAAEHTAVLTAAGVPAPVAEILAEVDGAIRRGRLAATPGDLSRLIGRPTTPLADGIAAALRG